jgi:hypothetical protein
MASEAQRSNPALIAIWIASAPCGRLAKTNIEIHNNNP